MPASIKLIITDCVVSPFFDATQTSPSRTRRAITHSGIQVRGVIPHAAHSQTLVSALPRYRRWLDSPALHAPPSAGRCAVARAAKAEKRLRTVKSSLADYLQYVAPEF